MRRVCGKAIEAAFSRQLHCDLVCERARRGKAKRVSLLCESLHRFTFATFGATTNTLTQCKFPSVSERANERTWEKTALSLSLCLKELSFEFVRSFAHSLAHALAFVLAFAFSFAQVCSFQIAHNYLSLCTKFRRLAHKMHALCRACENNEMRSDVEQ